MLTEYMTKVLDGDHLTTEEAKEAMSLIMSGDASPAQIAGFAIALKQKGETPEEVAGFVEAMRSHSVQLDLGEYADEAVDGCGTGGDGANTFNISTAASIVVAATGIPVAKHGNRSVSSKCGSADLLAGLGANIDPGPETVHRNITEVKFGFMFAPRFHPAMKHAAVPRRDLAIRTVFNILGPMTNPAGVKRQVIGVFNREVMYLIAEVLALLGAHHVLVAHSRDGLDEFSITAPTDYIEVKSGWIAKGTLSCEDVGLPERYPGVLEGGDVEFNKKLLMDILNGRESAYRDAVLLNAGAMIYVAAKAKSIADGVVKAAGAIDSGAAKELLDRWASATHP